MPRSKIFGSFAEAVADIPDGSTIGFSGFAVVGMPINIYGCEESQSNVVVDPAELPECSDHLQRGLDINGK